MEALTRFMAGLDTDLLRGSIVAAPIVNVTAFRGRSPFVTPEDGKNLNRCFPGRADGTHSEQLAHHVFTELISGSDLLIDLHGGDLVEALEPFTLFDASPVADRAEALARAYGLRYVIRGPEQRIEGTTSAAAADAGIPGITPEAGGCGLMEEDAIRAHTDGLTNALRQAGMLDGEPATRDDLRMVSRFIWLRAREAGWWAADVAAGDEVARRAATGRDARPGRRGARGGQRAGGRRRAVPDVQPRGRRRRHPARARRGLLIYRQPSASRSRTSATPAAQTSSISSSERW